MAMALRFIRHAEEEMAKVHRLQASEKAWGALAQQLKAIAEQRGWELEAHYRLYDIARYLDKEYQRRGRVGSTVLALAAGHRNFYENDVNEIQLDVAAEVVEELEGMRHRPPQPFTISTRSEQGMVRRLTGTEYAFPTTRRRGFVNDERLRERRSRWGEPPGESEPIARLPQPLVGGPSVAIPLPKRTPVP